MKYGSMVACLCVAMTASAQQFQLKASDGTLSGPFEVREGVVVAVGDGDATIVDVKTQEDSILNAMANIGIPELDFSDAGISAVLDVLTRRSSERDPRGRGVTISLNLAGLDKARLPIGHTEPHITFSARDITLLDALKLVVASSGLKYWLRDGVVMVTPMDAPEGEISVRRYDFGSSGYNRLYELQYRNDDPQEFGALDDPDYELKRVFTTLGISWPRGSSIKFAGRIGKLVVANTEENLAQFEALLDTLGLDPYQIQIDASFVAFDCADIAKISPSGITEARLSELWESGRAELIAAPKTITQSGQQTTVKAVTECIYPSVFRVTHDGGTNTNSTVIASVVEPSKFRTREVGVILEVLPEMSPDGRIIHLTFSAEFTEQPAWKDFGAAYVDSNHNEQQAHMPQPVFYSCSSRATLKVKCGHRILATGGMPLKDGKRVVYLFLAARKIGIDGEELKDVSDSDESQCLLGQEQ